MCSSFFSMKMLGSCMHDIIAKLMNLNAQQNKIPKLIKLPIVRLFGGLAFPRPWLQEMLNIVDNKLVLLCRWIPVKLKKKIQYFSTMENLKV